MKHAALTSCALLVWWVAFAVVPASPCQGEETRRLSMAEYRDKMAGGWIGQMAGVGWGGPTEFKWKGEIIPADRIPQWRPEMINQFHQDDIYVEMTFLRTLELHGWDVSIRQAGIDFANSGYPLWHANRAGRDNLRAGIAPPDSGHPKFNIHADDIDYQIEADYSGLIAPGMPQLVIELGEKFGRLMNYGDGLYGGQFVGGLYAEAFFEKDVRKIVEAGLACIPAGSQFAECIRDTIRWHDEDPDDWQVAWKKINEKYHLDPAYRKFSCSGAQDPFNIDAKINAAYIVMGLLYGGGDMDRTIVISTRCGQDSDCNPANSGGVLGTVLGRSGLPDKFTSAIDPKGVFSHTAYNFPSLVEVSEKLVREAVVRSGGRIEKTAAGQEILMIPVRAPKPSELEQCWEPGPAAESRYTEEEMKGITEGSVDKQVQGALDAVFPGWKISKCGADMNPGLRGEFRGVKNVFLSHPLSPEVACVIHREILVTEGATLRLKVAHDPRGDWTLVVKAGGKKLLEKPVTPDTAKDGWLELSVDLSSWAGKTIPVELINQASDWSFEAGYWAEIVVSGQ